MNAFSPLLERVHAVLPDDAPVYLVGGAVRDALLGHVSHDLDFALPGPVMPLARRIANRLGAVFFPLDVERDTARLILTAEDGSRTRLDFACLRGETLEADLAARDFTVNAIAVDVRKSNHLIDPLGGVADLQARCLRACAPNAFEEDPIRILRGIRLAVNLQFSLAAETRRWMKAAVAGLDRISPERLCEEFFRILEGRSPAAALGALDLMGAIPYILPELPSLKGVKQSAPHIDDVWTHTLSVVQKLEQLLEVLAPQPAEQVSANLWMGVISLRLGRYRQQLSDHFAAPIVPDRSLRALLFLAALCHDLGKPRVQTMDADGRIRFFGHEKVGADLSRARGDALHLSNAEVYRLGCIVENHMRPLWLAQSDKAPTRRAIYRFFRAAGRAGVDVCLLSLADVLATYGAQLPEDVWLTHLDVVRALLEAYWEQKETIVSPLALINGNELMEKFGLQPGPQIGEILEAVREAQAADQINDREQAFSLARDILDGADLDQGKMDSSAGS